jgi:hypothetical protein
MNNETIEGLGIVMPAVWCCVGAHDRNGHRESWCSPLRGNGRRWSKAIACPGTRVGYREQRGKTVRATGMF